jgi:hypothetical protein
MLETDTVQTNLSLLLMTLKPRTKHLEKKNRTRSRVSFCLPCSHQRRFSQTLEIARRQCHLSCPLIDQFISHQPHVRRYPHQLHLNFVLAQAQAQLFTFIHQRMSLMHNFPRQYSLDRTQPISENKTSLRRPITLAMCRSAVNRVLSSGLKTPAGLRGSYVKVHPHLFDGQQSLHNPQSKSHPYKKYPDVTVNCSRGITNE